MVKSILILACESCADKLTGAVAKALESEGKRVALIAPIADKDEDKCGNSVSNRDAVKMIAAGKQNDLVSLLVDRVIEAGKDKDIVVMKPIVDGGALRNAYDLNLALAHAAKSELIPTVCGSRNPTVESFIEATADTLKLFADKGFKLNVIASGAADDSAKAVEEKFGIKVINPNKADRLKAEEIKASSVVTTPVCFMRSLYDMARANKRTIVLPEGNVDRIIKAAAELRAQDVVNIVLLGDEAEIRAKAAEIGVSLDASIKIVNPKTDANLADYANTLFELRKAKGMTEDKALELMKDKTFFGTMMVYKGVADGMVSGATTSTAETIRPALQFVKTKPGIKTVSGVFLMALADRVYVYGDCAVIPNPTTDQLVDVAVASAATAKAFGIDPKIAMLSYSTGNSGSGPDVDAVREATAKAKEAAPDLLIEGPIQYDAAVSPEVAKTKLPDSPVAGKANVFVFPNLNAGNIGYKAVQRASGAIAIGPLLQGLKKPVNDLSRGATVADIVNTVIVTAIQAQN